MTAEGMSPAEKTISSSFIVDSEMTKIVIKFLFAGANTKFTV
jgi:hypothetical protein